MYVWKLEGLAGFVLQKCEERLILSRILNREGHKFELQEPKKKKDGKQDKPNDKKMAIVPSTGKQPPADGQVAEKDAKPLNKRKRETAELLQLAEKLQAKPARTGMKSNRKKYEFLNVVSCVDFVNNQKFWNISYLASSFWAGSALRDVYIPLTSLSIVAGTCKKRRKNDWRILRMRLCSENLKKKK